MIAYTILVVWLIVLVGGGVVLDLIFELGFWDKVWFIFAYFFATGFIGILIETIKGGSIGNLISYTFACSMLLWILRPWQ